MENGDERSVLQLCAEGFKERDIAKQYRNDKTALKNKKIKSYKRDFAAIAR